MPEKLLTLEEASETLGISAEAITELVKKGELPAYKVGGEFLRFRKELIEAIKSEIVPKKGTVPAATSHKKHIVKGHDSAYNQSLGDRISDFFYFNDFYIISGAIIFGLLIIIFKT